MASGYGLLDYLRETFNPPSSVVDRRYIDRSQWVPDHQRVGGHALEAPMFSPYDLIGTGIPTKVAGLLGSAIAPAAMMGLLGKSAEAKGVSLLSDNALANVSKGQQGMIKNGQNIVLTDPLGSPSPSATISGFGKKQGTFAEPEWYSISSVSDAVPKTKFSDFADAVVFAKSIGFDVVSQAKDGFGAKKASLLDGYTQDALAKMAKSQDEKFSEAKKVFVRYGELPVSGKSKNYRENIDEAGVSVFNGEMNKNGEFRVLPSSANEKASMIIMSDRPAYLVDGELVGLGSDGEPVLRNAKIIRRLTNSP